MKLFAILSTVVLAVPAFAVPQIQVTAILSGAPATEATTALKAPVSAEFKVAQVTTRPGQKAVIENIKEHVYPTAGGATPTNLETRNVGSTLEITAHLGAERFITFEGRLLVARVASTVAPTQNPHAVTASTVIARETVLTGRIRSGETAIIDVGERGRDFGQLKLTIKLVGETDLPN
jgi:hypothetical protein